MSKSYNKAVVIMLIALLLLVCVSLFFTFKIALQLQEQNFESLKKMEKQIDEGQLIGAAFFCCQNYNLTMNIEHSVLLNRLFLAEIV